MSRSSNYKTPSLLKDNSWIKKLDDEDEDVDRDPNFGKSVLSQVKTDETVSSEGGEIKTTTTTRKSSSSSSVQALSKRFGGSQDDLSSSSTLPSSKTTSSYTRSTYSSLKSPTTTTTSKTTVTEFPKTSTRTSSVSKDGKTTETTTTTTQSLRSPGIKSPTMTERFAERVKSSSKEPQYAGYSPTRTTKVTERTVSRNDAEDNLFDTLIPSSIKGDFSPTDSKTTVSTIEAVTVKSSTDTDAEDKLFGTLIPSKIKDDFSPTDSKTTISSTEYVTVRSSSDVHDTKTITTTRNSATPEDDLYGTLLPRSITSTSSLSSPVSSSITKREIITVESSRGIESPTLSSPSSNHRSTSYSSYNDDLPSTRTSSYTISTTPSYEYSSINSPTSYTTKSYRSSSRSDDVTADPIYSSSIKSVYGSSERAVLEKDLCSYCHKPFTGDAKMVLDDMKINCHATCFKCEVCNGNLSNMKAGDSMWIYKHMVHCENCFEVTRDKWRR
ncbi:sciellin isoform X2 [Cottoperca gobio]|uniref:Sciellin isoform X2 n=1 Tax=Cottoperca gobio TaxID=56716 RepID=A0A6J2RWN6_COTGO|nr:sciellin isoform X2 [Cottoperca gobio]